MKVNLVYILSNINKSLAFEWIAEEIDWQKFNLSFILLNPANSTIEKYLLSKNIPTFRINYSGKKDLPKAIAQIVGHLRHNKTDIVHCHLFDACVAGLIAAKLAGVPKRIYTRHHSTLHHLYFPRAVWYDRFINRLATDIVAISENVKRILEEKERIKPSKVHLIHHGFKLEYFSQCSEEKIGLLRKKYKLEDKSPVIGVISRYVDWKGIQYIIPAFKKLLVSYPNAHLVLANAVGDYKNFIVTLLNEIPEKNYTEIPFEEDIFSLYQLFDLFVHIPIDPQIEAFGQTYVEALAAGIPAIFTPSGVAPEFIVNNANACVVPFKSSEAVLESMQKILADKNLADKITSGGYAIIKDKFSLGKMVASLESLYKS